MEQNLIHNKKVCMPHISIISSSVRVGRNSHKVALYLNDYLTGNKLATTEVIDLKEYNFPIFDERLKYQGKPADLTLEFAEKIKKSDGVVIVTPEYNGGYPASLKNVIDLLYDEWHRKPISISTVSIGAFGGSQVITSLLFSLWKIGAWVVPKTLPISKVEEVFTKNGIIANKDKMDKQTEGFIKELLWYINIKRVAERTGI